MRFEFAIAAKYLIPRLKQFSTSIISLLSILVISLVVWLILVFMSVTDGLEKMWLDKLVSLNAPLRLTPTEQYFDSYYHKIDSVAHQSHYRFKTLQEKRESLYADPYDESIDSELPSYFPKADLDHAGNVKDLVKETFNAVEAVHSKGLKADTYEAAMTQFHLNINKTNSTLTNVSYVASIPAQNPRFPSILIKPSNEDLLNYLRVEEQDPELAGEKFQTFFENIKVNELKTNDLGWHLPWDLLPQTADFDTIAVHKNGEIIRFLLSPNKESTSKLYQKLIDNDYQVSRGNLHIDQEKFSYNGKNFPLTTPLVLADGFHFKAKFNPLSLEHAYFCEDLCFEIEGNIQGLPIRHEVNLTQGLEFNGASIKPDQPLWLNENLNLPDEGVIVPKIFKENGARLGDRGFLSYQAATGTALQEMQIPFFIAGFYDPGMMSMGGKILLVKPEVATLIRSSNGAQSQSTGAGIQVWFDDLEKAPQIKEKLIKELQARNLASYWNVETFHEYDFAKDLVQQLKSDKNLFTLLAIIIILVACSNIISMLILLVNDKKKEIGILQSMGASSSSIALIFGTCGVIMGILSSLIGTFAASITLANIQHLVHFLSALQGFDAFNAMFYGESLPSKMSSSALTMVWISTSIISLLAGLVPAIKASLMKPTAILRAE